MIIGIGIDLVEVSQFQTDVDHQKEPFLARVFTASERDYCSLQPDPYQSFAATFAAKEAAMKALGSGWTDTVDWQDIEVSRGPSGQPTLAFRGKVLEMGTQVGLKNLFLSLTHTTTNTVAVVILEG